MSNAELETWSLSAAIRVGTTSLVLFAICILLTMRTVKNDLYKGEGQTSTT